MPNKTIALIAAIDRNRVIGHKGKLPWNFPEDLKHFKELTTGHTVIMGRKTFEAIGKPLDKRQNIILSKDTEFQIEGCLVAHTLKEALNLASSNLIFIIGGQQLFQQTIELADILYLTEIEEAFQGDTFFPEFNTSNYEQITLKTSTHPFHAAFKMYKFNRTLPSSMDLN